MTFTSTAKEDPLLLPNSVSSVNSVGSTSVSEDVAVGPRGVSNELSNTSDRSVTDDMGDKQKSNDNSAAGATPADTRKSNIPVTMISDRQSQLIRRWEVDSWAETMMNWRDFWLAWLYELPPWYIGYLLAWKIEGRISAWNHFGQDGHWLLYIPMELYGLGSTWVWVIFLTYFSILISYEIEKATIYSTYDAKLEDTKDPFQQSKYREERGEKLENLAKQDGPIPYTLLQDVHVADVIFVMLCQIFRSFVIGLRYGYYPPSEMQMVRNTRQWWGDANRQVRSWGFPFYMDALKCLEADMMEQVLISALRNGLFPDIRWRFRFSSAESVVVGDESGVGRGDIASTKSHWPAQIVSNDNLLQNSLKIDARQRGIAYWLREAKVYLDYINNEDAWKAKPKSNDVDWPEFLSPTFNAMQYSKYGNCQHLLGLDRKFLADLDQLFACEEEDNHEEENSTMDRVVGSRGNADKKDKTKGAIIETAGDQTKAENLHANKNSDSTHTPLKYDHNRILHAQLSAVLVAFVVVRKGYRMRKKIDIPLIFRILFPNNAGNLYALLNPIVRWITIGNPFGLTPLGIFLYVIRYLAMAYKLGLTVAFACYPAYDMYARWKVVCSLLAAFGDVESLAELEMGVKDKKSKFHHTKLVPKGSYDRQSAGNLENILFGKLDRQGSMVLREKGRDYRRTDIAVEQDPVAEEFILGPGMRIVGNGESREKSYMKSEGSAAYRVDKVVGDNAKNRGREKYHHSDDQIVVDNDSDDDDLVKVVDSQVGLKKRKNNSSKVDPEVSTVSEQRNDDTITNKNSANEVAGHINNSTKEKKTTSGEKHGTTTAENPDPPPKQWREESELVDFLRNAQLRLETVEDLKAFWCIVRLTGPTFFANQSSRYSCGFSLLTACYLFISTVLLSLSIPNKATGGKIHWPFFADLSLVFAACFINTALSITLGLLVTMKMDKLLIVLSKASVINSANPEFVELANSIASDLKSWQESNPLRFAYVRITPQLFGSVYAYLTFLVSMVLGVLIANGWIDLTGSEKAIGGF